MGKLVHWAFAAVLLAAVSPALGHFNVILPENYAVWSATKGDSVPYRFVWGHGYEHVWFDATKPAALFAITPSGSKVDLLRKLKRKDVMGEDRAYHKAYSFPLEVDERGDYIVGMKAALIWDKEEEIFLQDYAKSILHVQDKLSWDQPANLDFELIPLTRPYGLQVGGVIQVQLLYHGKPLPGCQVELEKLQPFIPDEYDLPGEEFITFEAKSDPNGIVTFGLHEEGWFAITATRETGKEFTQGKRVGELIERSTFWINVAPLTVVSW
jgi:cobalt/nickel transport protein